MNTVVTYGSSQRLFSYLLTANVARAALGRYFVICCTTHSSQPPNGALHALFTALTQKPGSCEPCNSKSPKATVCSRRKLLHLANMGLHRNTCLLTLATPVASNNT